MVNSIEQRMKWGEKKDRRRKSERVSLSVCAVFFRCNVYVSLTFHMKMWLHSIKSYSLSPSLFVSLLISPCSFSHSFHSWLQICYLMPLFCTFVWLSLFPVESRCYPHCRWACNLLCSYYMHKQQYFDSFFFFGSKGIYVDF